MHMFPCLWSAAGSLCLRAVPQGCWLQPEAGWSSRLLWRGYDSMATSWAGAALTGSTHTLEV
jgi:hypothetical protein